MTPDLTCYGDDIKSLADLVSDFDLRSPIDTRAWYTREWEAIAESLGFAQPLAAELTRQRGAGDWVRATGEAGVSAFGAALRQLRPGVTDRHADVQGRVIAQMITAGRARGELWRVSVDPTSLETGACYEDEGGSLSRAFYPDTAPGYFGDGWPGPPPRAESRCGWTTPLVLHFGTFPWVYSSRLDVTGPALRWSSRSALPAVEALRVMASALQPEANLRQDARQVVAIYRHFRAQTAPLVARLPTYRPGAAAVVGQLYRHAGFLYLHQGSLSLAGLDGPRGRLPATAYNHVLRRFAVFFAVRRATVRALTTWAPEMGRLVATSADPCLRAQVEGVARAG
jgi:hypothetical protein